ncbi:uncharacterized protein [Coffea arabica]|uniref:Uncharacterized protein n=1 Tax=Coffea arabica TaxID=13443 RepID=A0ABM4UWG3_COFAR
MVQKTSLWLALLLLLLVLATSFYAVSTSRSLRTFNDQQLVHELSSQAVDEIGGDSLISNIDELLERRMEIETMDYPGTGPNNRHTPRRP